MTQSLATLFLLVSSVLGLYKQLPADASPAQRAQVDAVAQTVLSMVPQILAMPSSTPLGEVSTSSISIEAPTSTDASSTPITLNITQPAPAPLFGAVSPASTFPAVAEPKQVTWEDLVSTEVIEAGNGESGHAASGTVLIVYSSSNPYDSASFTVNGQTYPMTLTGRHNIASLTLDDVAAGLVSGQSYPYTKRVDAGDRFTTEGSTITIP